MTTGFGGRQQGFSLLIALILLALLSIIALQASRVSFYQTRMAADHEGKTQAVLAAEAGALRTYTLLSRAPSDQLIQTGQRWSGSELAAHVDAFDNRGASRETPFDLTQGVESAATADFWIKAVQRKAGEGEDIITIDSVGRGLDNTRARVALIARPKVEHRGVFDNVIHTNGDIRIINSGKIDSYDSRKGAYGEDNVSSGALVLNTGVNSTLTLDGSSPIEGSVATQGRVIVDGSARVGGDISAGGDVKLSGGGASVGGSVNSEGSVFIDNSGQVGGSVSADGNVTANGYGSNIKGNVQAGGSYSSTTVDQGRVSGTITQHLGNTVTVNVATPPEVALAETMARLAKTKSSGHMNIGPWRYNQVVITPTAVSYYDPQYNIQRWLSDASCIFIPDVDVLGTTASVLHLDKLSLNSDAHLFIRGGDVVLYVDGDFDIGGGASMTIEDGATLTLLLTGRFALSGAVNVESNRVVDDNGRPMFAIYSSYAKTHGKVGVSISGAASTHAVVYAPDTNVAITGSGALYGALVARNLEVSGAGGIHYDEALKDAAGNEGDSSTHWRIERFIYPRS